MKIAIPVAWVLRYIGSSTICTSTTLPSAGAITYCSPRGPERDGSRKKTSSHTASRNRTTSGTHTQGDPRATQAPSTTSAHPGRMNGQPSGASLTASPPPSSRVLQTPAGEAEERLQIALARCLHDLPRKGRRGGVAVPLAVLLQT